jgi:hypothetical protein
LPPAAESFQEMASCEWMPRPPAARRHHGAGADRHGAEGAGIVAAGEGLGDVGPVLAVGAAGAEASVAHRHEEVVAAEEAVGEGAHRRGERGACIPVLAVDR